MSSGTWTTPRPIASGLVSEGGSSWARARYSVGVTLACALLVAPVPAVSSGLGSNLTTGSLNVPTARLSDWTQTGVVGGIPNTSGWTVVNFTCNGTNDTAALQSAINDPSYPNGKIIQLPANNTCNLGPDGSVLWITRSNVVLRGAARWKGAGQGGTTILAGNAVDRGIDLHGTAGSATALASTPAAGAVQITAINSSHGIGVGDWFEVSETVATPDCGTGVPGTYSIYSNYGMCDDPAQQPSTRRGKMEVRQATAVSGTTISFAQPLRHSYGVNGGSAVAVTKWNAPKYVGLENLYFETNLPGCNSPEQWNWFFGSSYAVNWWARGNYFHRSPKAVLGTGPGAARFEFSDNVIDSEQRKSNGCNVGDGEVQIYMDQAADGKIVNNVILNTNTLMKLHEQAIGNVIAYNYVAPGNLCEADIYGRIIHVRGGLPSFNLFEGNDFGKCHVTLDSFWGSTGIGNTF